MKKPRPYEQGPSQRPKKTKSKKLTAAVSGSNWIWGIHPVLELLQSAPQRVLEIHLKTGKKGQKHEHIQELAALAHITVRERQTLVNEQQTHQGVEARTKPVPLLNLNELLKSIKQPNPLLLALDSIQDPHNMGALIRSASAAGVSGVLLPKDRSAPLAGVAAKTAAGAMALLDFCQVTNLSEALARLKKEHFWIFGADGQAPQTIYQTDLTGPICLVIGSEGKGVRPLVKKQCDQLVSIPMHSSLDSLNASVAGGIILFEIVRQRG